MKGAAGNGTPCIDQLVRIIVARIDQMVNTELRAGQKASVLDDLAAATGSYADVPWLCSAPYSKRKRYGLDGPSTLPAIATPRLAVGSEGNVGQSGCSTSQR